MRVVSRACFVVMMFIVASCSSGADTEIRSADTTLRQYDTASKSAVEVSPARVKKDTVFVREASAVFYSPDSLGIEAMKKEMGEEDFYIGADDYAYYLHLSDEYLRKQKLPMISVEGKTVLSFEASAGKPTLIRTDTIPERWGIYFFKPGAQPHFADMTIIEEEYKTYFGRK